ncbi:MAG TPA: sugar kinase [Elainellaceae cyanobacterium]
MTQNQMGSGLFVGLITLDLIYRVEQFPQPDQKMVALDYGLAAGGPATNAAATFSHLGNQAALVGVLGQHPIRHLIVDDLSQCGVAIADLQPQHDQPPSVSSIFVTHATGDRSVVSLNAARVQATPDQCPPDVLDDIDIVLIDGHQMEVGGAIARQARDRKIPVVVDGGSWKPGFDQVLHVTDYAICSANFIPPQCNTSNDVFAYLTNQGISNIAITHGDQPIQYMSHGQHGDLSVPQIQAADTLGAGGIFSGAFCHFLLRAQSDRSAPDRFSTALTQASQVAAFACRSFGTRQWMAKPRTLLNL